MTDLQDKEKSFARKTGYGAYILNLIKIIFVAVIVAGIINVFCFQLVRIEQTSMHPTLEDNYTVFLFKSAYLFSQPKSGDIIIFQSQTNSQTNYVKRVIGLPGDTIEIADGKVYRNGVELIEPYIAEPTLGSYKITVPEGRYFVMGDNRNYSMDSRSSSIGCITKAQILGKVLFAVRPYHMLESYRHDYADKIRAQQVPN